MNFIAAVLPSLFAAIGVCSGKDPFESLFTLPPCFPEIHFDDCNTTGLYEVYAPKRGDRFLNKPDTELYLFTTASKEEAEPLHKCAGRLPAETTFDIRHPTVVIVHGYLDGVCRTAWMREMREQLFIRGDYNVILVDFDWCNTFDVGGASTCSQAVAEQIALVLNNILKRFGVDARNFHIIAHSLGVFVTGLAAKFIPSLGRISALEPPVSPSRNLLPSMRLAKTDARFVDTYHTDAGTCFPFSFGGIQRRGHQDFTFNGGKVQLSCFPYIFTSLLKFDLLYAAGSLYPPLCFHLQVIQYFKATINPGNTTYLASQCNSLARFDAGRCATCRKPGPKCAPWGMDASLAPGQKPKERRLYYLNTLLTCPYA